MKLEKIPKQGTTISRKTFWDNVSDLVQSLQKKAGHNVKVSQFDGYGTIIDSIRERATVPVECTAPSVCCLLDDTDPEFPFSYVFLSGIWEHYCGAAMHDFGDGYWSVDGLEVSSGHCYYPTTTDCTGEPTCDFGIDVHLRLYQVGLVYHLVAFANAATLLGSDSGYLYFYCVLSQDDFNEAQSTGKTFSNQITSCIDTPFTSDDLTLWGISTYIVAAFDGSVRIASIT